MKKYIKSIVMTLFILLFIQQGVFAYTLTDSVYVKVREEIIIKNNIDQEAFVRVEPILANKLSESPYSIFLDERINIPFTKTEYIDDKMNRRGYIDVDNIKGNDKEIINYEYLSKLSKIDFNFNPNNIIVDYNYDSSLIKYLKSSHNIDITHPIVERRLNEIKETLSSEKQNHPYYITKAIFDYIQTNFKYTTDFRFSNKGSTIALKYLTGSCEEYSTAMVALLRKANIPARTVEGYRLKTTEVQKQEIDLLDPYNYKSHMWVEAYYKNYGWVAFDPTKSFWQRIDYQVVDEDGNLYLENGNPVVIKAKKPLPYPDYENFGKLSSYYIKDYYDVSKTTVRITGNAFDLGDTNDFSVNFITPTINVYAQQVDYNTFSEITGINIQEKLQYSGTPVQLTVKAVTKNGSSIDIDNSLITWSSSDETIATVDNGLVIFTGKNGYVEITAEYQGLITTKTVYVSEEVKGKPIKIEILGPIRYTEKEVQLKIKVFYKNGTSEIITEGIDWALSNPAIANIENGKLKFTGKVGASKITASYQRKKAFDIIIVSEKDININQKPKIVKVLVEPKFPTENESVKFIVIANIPEEDIVEYEWINLKNSYPAGNHLIKVRIKDKQGLRSNYKLVPLLVLKDKKIAQKLNKDEINSFGIYKIADSSKVERNIMEKIIKNKVVNTQKEFKDIKKHWSKKEIEVAQKMELISGYEDGTVRPDSNITRAEFVMMVSRALDITPVENASIFSDIKNHWAKGYINALNMLGVIGGYGDGTFRPDDKITRAEVITIISRIIDEKRVEDKTNTRFDDINNHWAKNHIEKWAKKGIINGVKPNKFAPDKKTTRAEAIVILIRALKLNKRIDIILSEIEKM